MPGEGRVAVVGVAYAWLSSREGVDESRERWREREKVAGEKESVGEGVG